MAGYKLTMLEKETIILFNEEEDTVCVKPRRRLPILIKLTSPTDTAESTRSYRRICSDFILQLRSARNGVRKCLVSAKQPICRGHSPLHERIVER